MLSTSTLYTLSQRADCVRESKERNSKAQKIENVKAIMQVAGTNGSFQKMKPGVDAGLKVLAFI